jgi:hypothetical protein
MARPAIIVLIVVLQLSVVALIGSPLADAFPLPVSHETSCGWKQVRVDGELKGSYTLLAHRVACHRAARLAARYELEKILPPGWYPRWANYDQEFFLCTSRQKHRCTHGRHVHMIFPDGQ